MLMKEVVGVFVRFHCAFNNMSTEYGPFRCFMSGMVVYLSVDLMN
jgi:hypothetical protein